MIRKPISADSHITEPPNCYVDYIDPEFRDRAPRIESLDGRRRRLRHRGHADAGAARACWPPPARSRRRSPPAASPFEDLWRSGWDPKYRLADQDLDGVAAEMIYPTVGMLLCNHPDFDFKKACFEAYNRWLAEYCAEAPHRLHRPGPGLDAHARRRRRRAEGGQGDGLQGRDDAGRPGGRGLRQPDLRPGVGHGGGAGPAALASTSSPPSRARWRRTRAGRASTASSPSSAAARTSWAR